MLSDFYFHPVGPYMGIRYSFPAQVRDFERVHSRDKHNQQSKKKAGEAAMKVMVISFLRARGTVIDRFRLR